MGRATGIPMTSRDSQINTFLAAGPWGNWRRDPLAGDASMRRYLRLTSPEGQTVVLMDAPPESNGSLAPYLDVTELLETRGVSVPKVLHQDQNLGLLVIEDLGDRLFASVMEAQPEQERPLYEAATDFLAGLHTAKAPDLPLLTPNVMAEMTALAFTEYRAAILGDDAPQTRLRFEEQFEKTLRGTLSADSVFVHRDFHAQNLIWLPERKAQKRVGVIDFQDARSGHCAYDLVSLLQDARRDVPPEIEKAMIERYLTTTGLARHDFETAYAVIGVQRNMRILGIFARLARKMGKPQYLDLLPRVWAHFIRGLDHPVLAPVAADLRMALPEPSPEVLRKLTS